MVSRLVARGCVLGVMVVDLTARSAIPTPMLLVKLDHGAPVYDLAVSPDGGFLASAGFDGSLRIWSIERRQALATVPAHEGIVAAVAFHPRRQLLATAGQDGMVKVWSLKGELSVGVQAHRGAATDLSFTPDGSQIVSGGLDGALAIWSYGQGAKGFTRHSNVELDGRPGRFDLEVLHGDVATVDFSPDGQLLAVGGTSGTMTIRKYPSLDVIQELSGHTQTINRAAFNLDGTRLVTASDDWSARVWDVATGKQLRMLRGYSNWVRCAAFSPDGKWIAVGSRDHKADVWDAATGTRLMSLPEQTAGVWAMAFSPTATLLVTGSYDGAIQLWNVGTAPR